jgi:hypothetical protein
MDAKRNQLTPVAYRAWFMAETSKQMKTLRWFLGATLLGALSTALLACPPTPPVVPTPTPTPSSTVGPAPTGSVPSPTGQPDAHTLRDRLEKARAARLEQLKKDEAFRGGLATSFGFEEAASYCATPAPITDADINPDMSLFVHDRATLDGADFSLKRTLKQMAEQAVLGGATGVTEESIFRELWDTQNRAPGVGSGSHCDDNDGTVNGFPVSCRSSEGAQATNPTAGIASYSPIALVNRVDLAHDGWRNCGEHRIVYGLQRNNGQRNFIIFEAVLPNPKPGCRSGCRPVVEFWGNLSNPALTPAQRAAELDKFFYTGLPGFRPVVHINHYTTEGVGSSYGSSGSGQIRTNQFMGGVWMLKEFRLQLDCGSSPCKLAVVPTMVKVNPFGALWREELATGPAAPFQELAQEFQGEFLSQVKGLAVADINAFGYPVSLKFDAAESQSQNPASPDNYLKVFNPTGPQAPGLFREKVSNHADLNGLTASQLISRATALSCSGCHQPAAFGLRNANSIGPASVGMNGAWPDSLGFVHTSELAPEGVHALSPALTQVFLPARKANLEALLNEQECACRRKFLALPAGLRKKALDIEEDILKKLKPRIKGALDAISAGRRKEAGRLPAPAKATQARAQANATNKAQEQDLKQQLAQQQITLEPLALDLKAQSVTLPVAQQANGDAKKERELRQKAVLDAIKREPPRRTVTGSFRVH